jgi:hypothetical protein
MKSHSQAADNTALEPVRLSKTVMSKFYLPEQKDSVLFGTLSFKMHNLVPEFDYSSLIAEIIRRRHPALMLCAGFSVIDEKALRKIAKASRNASSVILVETPPSKNEKAKNYRISDGVVVEMGQQFFTERNDRTEAVVLDLAKAVAQRKFDFDKRSALHNQRALLLVCGELAAVSGRDNPDYHKLVKQAPKLLDALSNATIILNPTHTRMANHGTLKAKRAFLSSENRIYLSSSNWNKDDVKGTEQKISPTLHSLWRNGVERKPCNECFDEKYFCYREWSLTG